MWPVVQFSLKVVNLNHRMHNVLAFVVDRSPFS